MWSTSLHEDLEYTALTSTWGDEPPSMTIIINGSGFRVRQNLWDFLNEYRSLGEVPALWIDALCINQSNVEERVHQVGLMSHIYSVASQTIVWLGCTAADKDGGLSNKKVCRNINVRLTEKRTRRLSAVHLARWTCSMSALSKLPYWSRLWIIQELILSFHAVLWLDRYRIAWSQIIANVSEVTAPGWLDIELGCSNMLGLVSLGKEDKPFMVEQLLRLNMNFHYSEALDVLYGGLGLLRNNWAEDHGIAIDYALQRVTSSGALCSQLVLSIISLVQICSGD